MCSPFLSAREIEMHQGVHSVRFRVAASVLPSLHVPFMPMLGTLRSRYELGYQANWAVDYTMLTGTQTRT